MTQLIEKEAKMKQMVYLQNIPACVNETRHARQPNLEIWSQKGSKGPLTTLGVV